MIFYKLTYQILKLILLHNVIYFKRFYLTTFITEFVIKITIKWIRDNNCELYKFVTKALTCRRVCRCSPACRHSTARAPAARRSGEQSSALSTGTDKACSRQGLGCRRNLPHSPRSGDHRCCQHSPVTHPLSTTLNTFVFYSYQGR